MFKNIAREHIWLGSLTLGSMSAFLAVFDPAISVLALVLFLIGIKGILFDFF